MLIASYSTGLFAQNASFNLTSSQPTFAELARIQEIVPPDLVNSARVIDVDYNALYQALINGAGGDFDLTLDGEVLLIPDLQELVVASRVFLDAGGEGNITPYQLPGSFFAGSEAGGDIVEATLYASGQLFSGWINAPLNGAAGRSYFSPMSLPGDVQPRLLCTRESFGTNPAENCTTVGCADASEAIVAAFPERRIGIAFEVDYEFWDGSDGNSTSQKTERAASSVIEKLLLVESNMAFYLNMFFLNMFFHSSDLSASLPNSPLKLSDLYGASIFLNTVIDDGLVGVNLSTASNRNVFETDMLRKYSVAPDQARACVSKNLVQNISGKASISGVLGHAFDELSGTPSTNSFICSSESVFLTDKEGGYTVAYQDPERRSDLNAGRIWHEILHVFGAEHTNIAGSNCGNCCNNPFTGSLMCGPGVYALSAATNRLNLYDFEQDVIRQVLDDHTSCLLVENTPEHIACADLSDCKISVEPSFIVEQRILGCDPPPVIDYNVEICNSCSPNTITDLSFNYSNSRFGISSLPAGYTLVNNGSTNDLVLDGSIALTPGECLTINLPFELLSYIPSVASDGLPISLDLTVSGSLNSFTLTRDVDINTFAPEMIVGGPDRANPVLLSNVTNSNGATPLPETSYSFGSVELDGVLAVDEDYLFQDVDFKLSPSAWIIIQAGHTLTIDQSLLQACGGLWNSIIVEDGAKLELINSTVKDANTAVTIEDGGQIKLSGSDFIDNQVGIDAIGNVGDGLWDAIQFNGSPSNFTYTGANPLVNATKTVGIRMTKQSALLLTPGFDRSVFSDLNTGLELINSSVLMAGFEFSGILNRAVDISSDSNPNQAAPETVTVLGAFGGLNIDQSEVGIYAKGNLNLTVQGAQISDTKIGVHSLATGVNYLLDNVLTDIETAGLTVGSGTTLPGITKIEGNSIHLDGFDFNTPAHGQAGIRIFDTPLSNRMSQIVNNSIDNASYRADGILAVEARNLLISENSVLQSVFNIGDGIELQGGVDPVLSCNSVLLSPNTAGLTGSLAGILVENTTAPTISCNEVDGLRVGVEFHGMNLGTELSTTEFGEHFRGLQLGLVDANQVAMSAQIGPQAHTGNLWRQAAVQNGHQAFFVDPNDINTLLSQFIVDGSLCADLTPANNAAGLGFSWIIDLLDNGMTLSCYDSGSVPCSSSSGNLVCLDGNFGSQQGGKLAGELEDSIRVNPQVLSTYLPVQELVQRQLLRETLADKYAADLDLSAFGQGLRIAAEAESDLAYTFSTNLASELELRLGEIATNLANTNPDPVVLESAIGESLSKIATTLDVNNFRTTVSADRLSYRTSIDSLRSLNEMGEVYAYWSSILDDQAITEEALKAVESLAESCYWNDGEDIYLARSLLWQQTPDLLIADLCRGDVQPEPKDRPNPGANLVAAPTTNSSLQLYPNPATDELWVEGVPRESVGTPLNWVIRDLNNRILQSGSWVLESSSGLKQRIELHADWAPGLYYLQVSGGSMDQTLKFVLQ